MREHLDVAVQPIPETNDVERQLVAHACPPLNLTMWANLHAPAIKAARKACVELARAAERRSLTTLHGV